MRPHSLISLLTRRLVLGSVLLTIVNIALVTGYYSLDRDELQREKISRQIGRLETALSRLPDGTLRFSPGERLIHDFRDYPEAYAYRILDHDGRVVDAANAGLVPPEVWAAVAASDAGSSTVQHEGRTVLVGSQKVDVGGRPARIGFASVGDAGGSTFACATACCCAAANAGQRSPCAGVGAGSGWACGGMEHRVSPRPRVVCRGLDTSG